ncbi:uncharacterized protein [Arachis hypogaea]|nr:uncharacterized protein LOC112741651 isoform X2 [Arachis hypogaea]
MLSSVSPLHSKGFWNRVKAPLLPLRSRVSAFFVNISPPRMTPWTSFSSDLPQIRLAVIVCSSQIYVAKVFQPPLLLLSQHHTSAACTAAVLTRRRTRLLLLHLANNFLIGHGGFSDLYPQCQVDLHSSTVGPHDVKIRIKAIGICGSDVHYDKTMRNLWY